MHTIELSFRDNSRVISQELYGIFLEDINFAVDGGLNANLVNNYSFDGVYLDKKKNTPVLDPLRFWMLQGGQIESRADRSLSENSRYARITAKRGARLSNRGYDGGRDHRGECVMAIRAGEDYVFRCWLRRGDYHGTLRVFMERSGQPLTEELILPVESADWQRVEGNLSGIRDGCGMLVIAFQGDGSLDLDCVEFYHADTWGKGDPKWRHGRFRRDLVQALYDLHPAFMRFPGGCIVEGRQKGNEYDWRDTVGSLWERKPKYNLWAERTEDGSYSQSYQIGFYEYFCLCEDLGVKPLPTLFAGYNCQARCRSRIKTEAPAFRDYVVQSYLDLISFATGDAETEPWAKKRAEMGHPAPFMLDRIGIGNENMGRDYMDKFDRIQRAIHEKYPQILCVMCAGMLPFPLMVRPYWKHAKKADCLFAIDEHSYHKPEWFFTASTRYDRYPRGLAKVYMGEYAANGLMSGKVVAESDANRFLSALSEAAFLTGLERNGDLVAMSSFAPLFKLAGSEQWPHNLIAFNPRHVLKTANYYVQQLFASALGTRGVDVIGALPERVFASATRSEDTLIIKLVNASAEALDLRLKVPHPDAGAVCTVLHCADPAMKNELSFSGMPEYRIVPHSYHVRPESGTFQLPVEAYSVLVIQIPKEKT